LPLPRLVCASLGGCSEGRSEKEQARRTAIGYISLAVDQTPVTVRSKAYKMFYKYDNNQITHI